MPDMSILNAAILEAIQGQDSYERAAELAVAIDAGRVRMMAETERRDSGRWTLDYRFEVQVDPDLDDWHPLIVGGWQTLGVTEAEAREEIRLLQLQNGLGIPDDPADLTDDDVADTRADYPCRECGQTFAEKGSLTCRWC